MAGTTGPASMAMAVLDFEGGKLHCLDSDTRTCSNISHAVIFEASGIQSTMGGLTFSVFSPVLVSRCVDIQGLGTRPKRPDGDKTNARVCEK